MSLEPSSAWNVDWGETACRLNRTFSSEQGPVYFQIVAYGPQNSVDVVISGTALKPLMRGKKRAIAFGSGGALSDRYAVQAAVNENGEPALVITGCIETHATKDPGERLNWPTPDEEKAIDSITIASDGKAVTLKTGSLHSPLESVRRCGADLVQSLLPDGIAAFTAKPIGNPSEWFHDRGFPISLLKQGENGYAHVAMTALPDGKPAACRVLHSYNDPDFDRHTCKVLMENARFEPLPTELVATHTGLYQTAVRYYSGG